MTESTIRFPLFLVLLLGVAACLPGSPVHCSGKNAHVPPADRAVLGCERKVRIPKNLPYRAWDLRFAHPAYMEVWIENSQVADIDGRHHRDTGGGTLSFGDAGGADPTGWLNSYGHPPYGAGRALPGMNLPRLIYVRWQSLLEPQTYEAVIKFPDSARREMVVEKAAMCRGADKPEMQFRKAVTLGLAPGGTIKVWVQGICLDAIEVMTLQADVVEEGPYKGEVREYVSASPEAIEHVRQHGIPFESWK